MTDPVFQALVARAGKETDQTEHFCVSCHSNIGTVAGRGGVGSAFDSFDPIVLEGVTCESCHRVTGVFRKSNAGHVLDPESPMQGTVRAGNRSPYHETEKSAVLGTPELCASCHDVSSQSGLQLEQPYVEWSDSQARTNGLVCIDCHMPRTLGRSAEGFGLPERPVRQHAFLGIGALAAATASHASEADAIGREVRELLGRSVAVSIESDVFSARGRARLYVVVHNRVEGHRFPTGSAFFRQLWLRVRVRDAQGTLLFDSQARARNNASTPTPSLLLSARLFDDAGQVTQLPWHAARVENNSLQAGEERLIPIAFELDASNEGPLWVEASLELRSFPEDLLEELGLARELATVFEVSAVTSIRPIVRE